MNPPQPAKATRSQKWLTGIFVLVSMGTILPILSRSFAPSRAWQLHALDIALSLTTVVCAWVWWLYRHKQWRPAGLWQTYSPLKQALIAPMCLAYFIFALWVNVMVTVPMIYTAATGVAATQTASATKAPGTGRYSCRYQLKVPEITYVMFEFCMDEDAYRAAPKGLNPAELSVRQSYFGFQVHSIAVSDERSMSTQVFTANRIALRLPPAITDWLNSLLSAKNP